VFVCIVFSPVHFFLSFFSLPLHRTPTHPPQPGSGGSSALSSSGGLAADPLQEIVSLYANVDWSRRMDAVLRLKSFLAYVR
jgi:hypothetical protein